MVTLSPKGAVIFSVVKQTEDATCREQAPGALTLSTLLLNFYASRKTPEKWMDAAYKLLRFRVFCYSSRCELSRLLHREMCAELAQELDTRALLLES